MKMFSLQTPVFFATSLSPVFAKNAERRPISRFFWQTTFLTHSPCVPYQCIIFLCVYVALSLSTYEDREIKCSAGAHMKTENRANLDILDSKTLGTCARLTMCLSDLLQQLLRVFAISHLRG